MIVFEMWSLNAPLVATGACFEDGASSEKSPSPCKKKIKSNEYEKERCI